jgi:mono/diheme cytochrome c family protein
MHRASNRRSRRGAWGVATAFVLVLFVSVPFFAAPPSGGSGDDLAARREGAARGRVTYQVYCRSCHGDHGRGDGMVASVLKTPPTDLTGLARTNGGELPSERVFQVIDGREDVAAHGSREMPVWGNAFRSPDGEGGEEEEAAIRTRIQDLVDYLTSIQK